VRQASLCEAAGLRDFRHRSKRGEISVDSRFWVLIPWSAATQPHRLLNASPAFADSPIPSSDSGSSRYPSALSGSLRSIPRSKSLAERLPGRRVIGPQLHAALESSRSGIAFRRRDASLGGRTRPRVAPIAVHQKASRPAHPSVPEFGISPKSQSFNVLRDRKRLHCESSIRRKTVILFLNRRLR
jgi:hypothetical protein